MWSQHNKLHNYVKNFLMYFKVVTTAASYTYKNIITMIANILLTSSLIAE